MVLSELFLIRTAHHNDELTIWVLYVFDAIRNRKNPNGEVSIYICPSQCCSFCKHEVLEMITNPSLAVSNVYSVHLSIFQGCSVNNPKFRMLCGQLGLYSTNTLIEYLKFIQAERYGSDSVVRKWFNGAADVPIEVPEFVQEAVIGLREMQKKLIGYLGSTYVDQKKPIVTYQTKEAMWSAHPRLQGLPVSFLDQAIAQLLLQLGLDNYPMVYFEHLSVNSELTETTIVQS